MENTSPEISVKPRENDEHVTPNVARKTSHFFPLLNFLLLILLIAAVAWIWHDTQKWQMQVMLTEGHINKIFSAQNQAQANLNEETDHLTHQLQQQQAQLNTLNTQVAQIVQHASGAEKTWKINEIVYLVQLANLQLTVQHSVSTALSLLKMAESQLTALADPSMEGFHQAVLKNITTLQTIPPLDIVSVSLQLNSLRDQVPDLSVLVAPKPNTSVLLATEHQINKKWWQRAWDNIKASMQALVVVRHQNQTLPALMSPDQQVYLQENLQLSLIQAEWALMNHQQTLYQNSLKQAKSWVDKFYVQNSATTQAFLKTLQTLQSINVAPTLPDLTPTLALVNQE